MCWRELVLRELDQHDLHSFGSLAPSPMPCALLGFLFQGRKISLDLPPNVKGRVNARVSHFPLDVDSPSLPLVRRWIFTTRIPRQALLLLLLLLTFALDDCSLLPRLLPRPLTLPPSRFLPLELRRILSLPTSTSRLPITLNQAPPSTTRPATEGEEAPLPGGKEEEEGSLC